MMQSDKMHLMSLLLITSPITLNPPNIIITNKADYLMEVFLK